MFDKPMIMIVLVLTLSSCAAIRDRNIALYIDKDCIELRGALYKNRNRAAELRRCTSRCHNEFWLIDLDAKRKVIESFMDTKRCW